MTTTGPFVYLDNYFDVHTKVHMKAGFGAWRFFLAFIVAISHLWAGMIDGPAAYAVWGFFVLSGYLITLGLTTRYASGGAGLRRFAFNRLLRIYPSYLAAAALGITTVLLLRHFGIDPAGLNPQFMLPQNGCEWFGNIAMLPFYPQRGLAVPVAGALFVEVWAYALMPLFARSTSAAWLGFSVALASNLQSGLGMDSFVWRYCGFATGLLPFAVGALACHYRQALRRAARPRMSVLAWCLHGLYWLRDPYWPWTWGLLLSVPLSAWVVTSLVDCRAGAADRIVGDLSYPVYLLHTTVAAWFLPIFGFARGFSFFVVSFLATMILSTVMLWAVDRKLQRLRERVPAEALNRTLPLGIALRRWLPGVPGPTQPPS